MRLKTDNHSIQQLQHGIITDDKYVKKGSNSNGFIPR
jgi:hypothetical protein